MEAIYFDGKSAAAHNVKILVNNRQLRLNSVDSAASVIAILPLDSLILDSANTSQTVLLGANGVRVKLTTPNAGDWLKQHGLLKPQLFSSYRWSYRRLAALVVFFFVFIGVAIWNIPRLASPLIVFIPQSVDIEIGKLVLDASIKNFGYVCNDRTAQAALQRLVDKLQAATDTKGKVNSSLVSSSKVNAFATPGNNIVVLTGLIKLTESPEELAGVIGHELGHLARRHSMQRIVGSIGVKIFTLYLAGNSGSLGETSLRMAGLLSEKSHSRNQEREADKIGIGLMAGAGIDSTGVSTLFTRLAGRDKEKSVLKDFTSSHPPSEERAKTVASMAKSGGSAMSQADWQALKGACS